jgi:hypothetical protein
LSMFWNFQKLSSSRCLTIWINNVMFCSAGSCPCV